MKYPAYPRYKPSGVEWLGDVPENWPVERVSLLSRPGAKTFTDGDWVELPYITAEGIRLLQTGNVGVGAFREQGFRYIEEATFSKLRCTEVMPGDILICRLADPVGRACLAPDLESRMITSVDVCILKPAHFMDRRYIVYFFSSKPYLDFVDSLCRGGTRERISRAMLGAIRALVPPVSEQCVIADFLDAQTAKLDVLMAKKRTLIERLKEKRTALISCTVTRGLPPDAARAAGLDPHPKLRPSGIDWLGDIPEHWEVRRMAMVASKITNGFVGPTRDILVDEGVAYLQSLHIKDEQIVFGNDYFVTPEWSQEHAKSILKEGDVLIVQTGDIGQVAWVPKDYEGCNCHALIIVSPRPEHLIGRFLSRFLNSSFGFDELKRIQTGALHPHLNCGLVRDVRFPLPPLAEQHAIAAYLDRETGKMDHMIAKVEAAIERLQEYRTALVSAAVTGKIDVRGRAATAGQSEPQARREADRQPIPNTV